MPSLAPTSSSELAMLLRPSPTNAKEMSCNGFGQCSVMVSTSASIWVGWNSSVSPLKTGTPAYSASSSTVSWALPRYSIASYIRPSTRAVSFIDSLCPICDDVGIDVGDVGALVVGRHLERAAGAGGRLLEDESDVLARQAVPAAAGVLCPLQISGQVEQVVQVPIGVMDQAEQTAVAIVERHVGFVLG